MIITFQQVEVFLFILARMAGFFIEAPVFSAKSLPTFVKACMAIWLSLIMWFIVPVKFLPDSMPLLILGLFCEVLIGFTLGYVASIVLQSAQAAGDILDMQMGLSVANILSPTTGLMTSITGSFLYLVALLTFFIINGHHMLISAIHQSFVALPIMSFVDFSRPSLIFYIIDLLRIFWISAIQIAAPMLLLIFLLDFSFGIVSRVAPQVNVFQLGFQVKPTLGLFGISLISPIIIAHMTGLISNSTSQIARTILIMGGR